MAPKVKDTQLAPIGQEEFESLLQEQVRQAVRLALVTILEAEVEAFIGALPYERSPKRQDQRNGYYTRDLDTTVGRVKALPVPRTRQGFKTQLFRRYQRRRQELDTAISEMFIRGVSTRGVSEVFEGLTGSQASPSTVSRVFHTLDEEFEAWRTRPLAERYEYVFADGTYFTVIYGQEGCKMPILAAVGIRPDGQREVLGFTIGDRENQQAWEDLFEDLKQRGVKEIGLCITDGNQATINALEAKFPGTPRQRCVKHKMENVLSYVPKTQQEAVEPELKAIFYQDSREEAAQAVAAFCEKYESVYPTAVACLKRDLDACLTFYAFPKAHWRTIRTTNVIERLFGEVKKRSHKMATAFRNVGSCLLMFYAVIRSLKFKRLAMPAKHAA